MQSFTISTLDITKAKINAIPNQSYVGASVTPVPTITYANRQLTNGVDFTVTYSNNNFPGTGKATITGIYISYAYSPMHLVVNRKLFVSVSPASKVII